MKILITGGAGLIGSHAAEYYAKKGNEVIVLDNLMRSSLFGYNRESVEFNWNYLGDFENIKRIKGDIREEKDVIKALGNGVDAVIHAAGQPGVPLSIRIPREDFSINAYGTLNVLECVREVCPKASFIYCSSNKIYGENVDKIPLEEKETRYTYKSKKGVSEDLSMDLTGHTPYGVSKYCLPPDSIIITNRGIKKIEEIVEGDIVLTHDGTFKKVTKLFKRIHNSKIYKINTYYGGDTYLTPEHPVLISTKNRNYFNKYKVKNRNYSNRRRYGNKLENEALEWILAKNLKKGYFAVFPRLKPKQTLLKINIKNFLSHKKIKEDFKNIYYNCGSGVSVRIKNTIPLDKEFMRLAGYYLSEGGVTTGKSPQLTFSFNRNEKEYIKDVIELIYKFFGTKPSILTRGECSHVCIKSKIIALFFAKFLGHGAHNKYLPEVILNKPGDALIELLKGYWRGDGDFHSKNRKIRFSTCNYGLAVQLKLILTKLGFISGVFKHKRKDGFKKGTIKYSVEVNGLSNDVLIDLLNIEKYYKAKSRKRKSKGFISGTYFYYPIRDVKEIKYNGYVYNLEVEGNHSYITENLTLHNCGDIYTQEYGHIYGMKTAVFRMSCIYGTRQFGFEDQGWVAWFVIANLTGQEIVIYGDGKQVRDLLYIEDLVEAYDKFINSGITHEVFNIGGGPRNTTSLLEFISQIEAKTGIKFRKVEYKAWRPSDQKVYISDITKVSKALDWKPCITPEKGLQRLIEWISANTRFFI